MTSVRAFLEATLMKMLVDECNYKIKLIANTGEPMKNKDQVGCCYLEDKMDSLII